MTLLSSAYTLPCKYDGLHAFVYKNFCAMDLFRKVICLLLIRCWYIDLTNIIVPLFFHRLSNYRVAIITMTPSFNGTIIC